MKCKLSLKKIVLFLFFIVIISCVITSVTTAEETGPRTIGNMYVSPMYEDSVPIDDGKVIHVLSGLDYLQFWRHKIVSELSGFFSHTVLYETFIFLSPLIFALLGFICLLLCTADRRKKPSSLQENILLSIRENPGITQKQITDTVRCSRGSVCYHLHQLEKTGKIRKLHLGTAPQYYPSAELPSPDTLLEQTILLLLSRKKSGKFLRTLYENPCITQKRTCRTPQHPSDNRPLVPSHLHQKPHTLRRTKRPGTPLLPHPRSRNNLHPPHTRHPKPLNQKKRKNKKRITHDPQSAVPSQNNQPSSYPHGKYLPYGTRPQEPTQPQPPPHPPQPQATTNTAEASPSTKS